ncbi:PaaI family thioesterase [Emcibacter nanhaiensis]|uniref:PaaI family thioesterase n=1 Tax=Emcibacter nanhaiensis TaxID=1505037 RepID=A0A501PPR0_9PROT|nr:PaaI family thioesterase [Emcibacter nanhaiensis]TPD61776.1 PaaI family thioesterase [Emcibacter nanhaiensis]
MIVGEFKPLLGKDDFDHEVCDGGYGELLNLVLRRRAGRLSTVMKFDHDLIGSPLPPALHGGAIAGMMEVAAYCQLIWDLEMSKSPKTVDMNIDYLRSGKPQDLFAEAEVVRMGRRFANLHVTAWQDDRDKPIAKAHLHFLVIDDA